jgi:hypothetical protein
MKNLLLFASILSAISCGLNKKFKPLTAIETNHDSVVVAPQPGMAEKPQYDSLKLQLNTEKRRRREQK